ncbi:hypothetical protein BGZ83_006633 [Gryganskiella cystojenkinii]|nr:hypothetical protein BGZ83_006633 [Gryganskiella cystojenkinii]
MDGTIITPPPLRSRSNYGVRRRHNSCVAPNTKEFHTLATIFGWVTVTADDTWPTNPGRTATDQALDAQYEGGSHLAAESGDESDMDDTTSQCETHMNWTSSQSSSSARHADISPPSPFGDSTDSYHSASSSHDNGYVQQQGSSQFYGEELTQTIHPFYLTEHETRSRGRRRNSERLFINPKSEYNGEQAPFSPFRAFDSTEISPWQSIESSNFSEHSDPIKNAGADMSPTGCLYPSSRITPRRVSLEINPLEVSEKKRASTKTDRIPSPEATPTALDAPPIPPPFLEIDARVFDITEEAEENCSIVYGQQTEQITDSVSGGNESRPIVAGSIVKVIEKLTHQYGLDNGFMTDFFLTYRLFMSPVQLCKYLIQRYLWALEQDTESRCVVRVRTFAVLRHWIKTHFADDFLTSKSLRFQMALFLNEMRFNAKVQGSTRDARIIKSLMELFKAQRRHYKALAEESLAAEKTLEPNPRASNDAKSSPKEEKTDDSVHPLQFHDPESEVAVESLDVARIWREAEVTVVKSTKSDISDSMSSATPIKARLRASTMAGPLAPATDGSQPSNSKRGKDARVPPMTRQTSDGTFVERERRLSASSIKSARSSTWSAKMTLGIHKLRQKSEDMFQQLVNPTNAQTKSYSRQCVCWTPTFTGIADHPALNTARSHPILRSTVAAQGVFSQEATATAGLSNVGVGSGHHPSNKSIKRLKSSLTLGSSNNSSSISGTATSPNRSPTLAQFSNLTSRHSRSHSRSNSNTSVGYHPNPNCPFHIPCMESIQSNDHPHPGSASLPSSRLSKESTYVHDDNSKLSVHEFLEMENQPPPVPPLPSSIPPSPAWPYSPWSIHSDNHHDSHPSSVTTVPAYKPFILYYRSQAIAQQLCLLEQHFLEQVNWEEFLELELTKAGRKKRSKSQSSISGYLFKTEYQRSGIDASNERSNKLCMWVASEVVSTQPIEDRVRVIEKFIRIAQKCYQYRNYNSLIQLVMGLGSSHLCGLRRTWSRVGSYEMHVLQDLQDFISPCGNWNVLRKAMNRVNENEPEVEIRGGQRSSLQAALDSAGLTSSLAPSGSYVSGLEYPQGHFSGEGDTLGHSKYLQHQTPFDQQGCIPFLGLFVFDLTHIAVSPSWFLPPQVSSSTLSHELNAVESGVTNRMQEGTVSRGPRCVSRQNPGLVAASPNDLPNLLSTGTLLVHFHKFQLIAKTLKWFLAFQRRPRKYTFTVDPILYSKCFLLRVLKEERLRELAESCEID